MKGLDLIMKLDGDRGRSSLSKIQLEDALRFAEEASGLKMSPRAKFVTFLMLAGVPSKLCVALSMGGVPTEGEEAAEEYLFDFLEFLNGEENRCSMNPIDAFDAVRFVEEEIGINLSARSKLLLYLLLTGAPPKLSVSLATILSPSGEKTSEKPPYTSDTPQSGEKEDGE